MRTTCVVLSSPDRLRQGIFAARLQTGPGQEVYNLAVSGEEPVTEKTVLMEAEDMRRALTRIAHEILERNQGTAGLFLVGIHTRGYPLALRLGERIASIEGEQVPVGGLDVTPFRDDLEPGQARQARQASFAFGGLDRGSAAGRRVVLVDDVLYTGRTVRAALDGLMEFGRPRLLQLAVLVDRGHRELPVRPDYVGKNVPTSRREFVEVRLQEVDAEDRVVLREKDGGGKRRDPRTGHHGPREQD